MYIITIFLILLVTAAVSCNASVFENNDTNIGVFVNHLSSCNLNHDNGNMICINQDYNTIIQYHNVNQVAMCPYHYCVLFEGSYQYSCTGYILTLIGGAMDKHLNPLTPNTSYVGFTGNPDDDHISVGYTFLGYNVLIDYFEQNVNNFSPKIINKISCMEPYSTHILYGDGSEETFGGVGIIFRNTVESLNLGVLIHTLIAFIMYMFILSFCKIKNVMCINLFAIPLITFVSCYLILFVAEDFVVKIFPFTISSIIGVVIGYMLSSILFNSILFWRNMKQNVKVDAEETAQFVIGTDDDIDIEEEEEVAAGSNNENGMTEIELGHMKRI
jgi:hypothetical protein